MTDKFQQLADRLDNAISQGDQGVIQAILLQASSAETARLLESLPPKERLHVWPQVTPKRCAKVLLALPQPLRRALIEQTEEAKLVIGLSQMQMDELADIDADLPIPVVSAMVQAMDAQRRLRYERVRDYPDQSAGG